MKNIPIKSNNKLKNLIMSIKNNTRKFNFFFLIIVSLLIFNLDRTNNQIIISAKSYILNATITLPIKVSFHLIDYLDTMKSFFTKYENLILENQELKKQNSLLSRNDLLINMLNIENIKLRNLTNFLSINKKIEYISTRILSTSNEFHNYALIPLGDAHGIEYNQAVINDQGLIGKIIKVEKNFSQILLIKDKKFRIPVKILNSATDAIITGCNNKYLKLLYLSDQHNIQDRSVVVSSGNDNIPAGIYIGHTYEKDKVIINIDFQTIDFVSVVKIKNG